jgi:hypothetical protein
MPRWQAARAVPLALSPPRTASRALSPPAPHGLPPPPAPPPPAGIKTPKPQRYRSTKGMDPKFLRNQRFAKKGTEAGKA